MTPSPGGYHAQLANHLDFLNRPPPAVAAAGSRMTTASIHTRKTPRPERKMAGSVTRLRRRRSDRRPKQSAGLIHASKPSSAEGMFHPAGSPYNLPMLIKKP